MPLPPFLRWLSSSQAQSPPLQRQTIQEQIDPTAFSASPTQEDQYWGRLATGTEEDYYWRRLSDNWYAKDVIPITSSLYKRKNLLLSLLTSVLHLSTVSQQS